VVDVAADLAEYILQEDSERLEHSRAVAERAKFLTLAVDDDQAPLLVAAAWLHDIGYAPGLKQTGFHPLDGANHLRAAGWPAIEPVGKVKVSTHRYSVMTKGQTWQESLPDCANQRHVGRIAQRGRAASVWLFSRSSTAMAVSITAQRLPVHCAHPASTQGDANRNRGPGGPALLATATNSSSIVVVGVR
jgi:hypothetical protein